MFCKELCCIVKMFIHALGRTTIFLYMLIGYGFNLGIQFLYLLINHVVSLFIIRTPVFITNFQIGHFKGFRMPHRSTKPSPFAFLRADSIFNGIQCILYHFIKSLSFQKDTLSSLTGHSAVTYIHGLHPQILAKLQIFMKAKS